MIGWNFTCLNNFVNNNNIPSVLPQVGSGEPKQFCQLPKFPFPKYYPEYPSNRQFLEYLESYARHFDLRPQFKECVQSAKYDEVCQLWRVKTVSADGSEVEYICKWLVVATTEKAEIVVPEIDGLKELVEVIHDCDYKSGEKFRGKKVVDGCGNLGMEVSLDLCNHDAQPSMICHSAGHVLPREIFGKSTFELAMLLMAWLPLWLVEKILLILTWFKLGNIEKYGLKRPSVGPLQLKNTRGKTPVLDIDTLAKIKAGKVKVVSEIKKFSCDKPVTGEELDVDSVILATGYCRNVLYWLQGSEFLSKNGYLNAEFPNNWKGKSGLYAVGFTKRGLAGPSADAIKIAKDIDKVFKEHLKQKKEKVPIHRRCISTV